ncbi:MAG: hypothetical protein PVJ66_08720 [Gammaproteobacteria bacterium]|jgi:hypothetical protein
MDDPVERGSKISVRVGHSLIAGLAATVVLWALKLTSGTLPQLETIRFLDRVAEATARATGLPDPLRAGWLWHLAIGTLLWGTLFGIMLPVLPGQRYWVKGIAFGIIAGMLTMLMVMPLAGAGYFGMELTLLDPVISLVYHIVYGVTLGGVYAVLAGRNAMTG